MDEASLIMKHQLRPALAIISTSAALMTAAAAAASPETLNNLNVAYQNESNAARRYEAFAKKADSENLPQIAKLFRATAASEAFHRDIQKSAILKLGGQLPTFKLDEIPATATSDNLKASIKGEIEEHDTLYPAFLGKAKSDEAKAAVRAFNYSIAAEKRHAEYFQQALDQIGKNPPATYYLCEDCGLMLDKLPDKKCPVCREGLKSFKIIN